MYCTIRDSRLKATSDYFSFEGKRGNMEKKLKTNNKKKTHKTIFFFTEM